MKIQKLHLREAVLGTRLLTSAVYDMTYEAGLVTVRREAHGDRAAVWTCVPMANVNSMEPLAETKPAKK
jgi:hypothetical protein